MSIDVETRVLNEDPLETSQMVGLNLSHDSKSLQPDAMSWQRVICLQKYKEQGVHGLDGKDVASCSKDKQC